MQNRTNHLARIIAAASVAFAIFTGLAACQEPGTTDVTVGGADEQAAAAPSTTTTAVSETTVEDTSADDGGGLPADGALVAAAQRQANPSAFTTRSALDEQAQAAAQAEAAAQAATTTTTAAPTTTAAAAAPETTTTTAPPPPPAPVAPAPAPTGGMTAAEASFLHCVKMRESGGNYSVVSANGLYYGAYQFHRSTWDNTASHAGRGDLVGVPPNMASPADQDAMALHLYRWQGPAPWGGYC